MEELFNKVHPNKENYSSYSPTISQQIYDYKKQQKIVEISTKKYPNKVISSLIGKEGKNFYDLTTHYNLKFIWHNSKTKKIEFWSEQTDHIQEAITDIQNQLDNLHDRYNQENSTTLDVNNYLPKTISIVIGKKGFYFKQLCKQYKLSHIWYNHSKKIITIWGNTDEVRMKIYHLLSDKLMTLEKQNIELIE